jgi:hypothetical protein
MASFRCSGGADVRMQREHAHAHTHTHAHTPTHTGVPEPAAAEHQGATTLQRAGQVAGRRTICKRQGSALSLLFSASIVILLTLACARLGVPCCQVIAANQMGSLIQKLKEVADEKVADEKVCVDFFLKKSLVDYLLLGYDHVVLRTLVCRRRRERRRSRRSRIDGETRRGECLGRICTWCFGVVPSTQRQRDKAVDCESGEAGREPCQRTIQNSRGVRVCLCACRLGAWEESISGVAQAVDRAP